MTFSKWMRHLDNHITRRLARHLPVWFIMILISVTVHMRGTLFKLVCNLATLESQIPTNVHSNVTNFSGFHCLIFFSRLSSLIVTARNGSSLVFEGRKCLFALSSGCREGCHLQTRRIPDEDWKCIYNSGSKR